MESHRINVQQYYQYNNYEQCLVETDDRFELYALNDYIFCPTQLNNEKWDFFTSLWHQTKTIFLV